MSRVFQFTDKCWTVILFLVFVHCIQSHPEEQSNASEEIFVPTNEWQPVKPRQPVPPGLHVRFNLSTGLTEAKLFDPNNQSATSSDGGMVLVTSDQVNTSSSVVGSDNQQTSFNPLVGPPGISHVKDNPSQHNTTELPNKFRTIEQLKSDLNSLWASMKTDLEIIDELIKQLNTVSSTEQTKYLLGDLSYLLHQVDNGQYFAENNGFSLLLKFMRHPNVDIQVASLSAVTAAVQGNSRVKVIAFQNQTLNAMCTLLSSSLNLTSKNLTFIKLASAWLTALGAFLRDFPSAQRYFFTHPGIVELGHSGSELLSNVYNLQSDEIFSDQSLTKLRIRVVNFMADLMAEKTSAREHAQNSSDQNKIKLWELYAALPLEELLQRDGWCAKLHQLLVNDLQPAVPEAELSIPFNHSQRQSILTIMLHLFPICKQSFSFNSNVDSVLANLEHEYYLRSRTRDSEHDFYFLDLYELIVKVRGLLN